jgi:hypothetical protein
VIQQLRQDGGQLDSSVFSAAVQRVTALRDGLQ